MRAGVDQQKLEATRRLDDAFEHIVWAEGEQQKAQPFWDDGGEVPDFVSEVIDSVVEDSVWDDIESIPEATRERLTEIFEKNLTQPQGWSLESMTDDIADAFGADEDAAEMVARTESANILNNAREEGYRQSGAIGADDGEDEALFVWMGPQDHNTTDACEWLKDQTEGGVTFSDLIRLQKDAAERFFPNLDWRRHTVHPNERHTFRETFKLDHPSAEEAVVEYDLDLAPAIGGTFKAVEA